MNTIRIGVTILVAIAVAGCAANRSVQRQVADESCGYPNTMTCEEFAGELYNCVCANDDDLRRMFEILSGR